MTRLGIDAFQFLIMALSVYRVSYMVAREDGPFDAFLGLRNYIINRRERGAMRTGISKAPSWIERGLNCIMCVSFWAGLVAALPYLIGLENNIIIQFIYLGTALSGVVILLQKVFK